MACDFNCPTETEGLFSVSGSSHVHCLKVVISVNRCKIETWLLLNVFGASSELAPNMFGASSELASVMEFGFQYV